MIAYIYYTGTSTQYLPSPTSSLYVTGKIFDIAEEALNRAFNPRGSFRPVGPPKNWRWFHCFTPIRAIRRILPVVETLANRLRRFVKGAAADFRRMKRKRFVQSLRA